MKAKARILTLFVLGAIVLLSFSITSNSSELNSRIPSKEIQAEKSNAGILLMEDPNQWKY